MVPTFCVDCDEVTPRDNGTRCLMCKLRAERDALQEDIAIYKRTLRDVENLLRDTKTIIGEE